MTLQISTPEPDALLTILNTQRNAFLRDGIPTLEQRRADLKKFRLALISKRNDIREAINTDFGHRSKTETDIVEILGVVEGMKYLEKNLRKFMRPERRNVAIHMRLGKARVEYQPLGVVGVISPWNYPINLALMPVVTAIAAGNRVMLKPSKNTPKTNEVIDKLFSEIFPKEQVTMVDGDGAAFSKLPFDHLVFTGSTKVGRSIMKAASENLVPVTLELGGKSPVIISKGYSLEKASARIVYGKLLSAGQTCIAPDYVLVHETEVDHFIKAYDNEVKKAYPDGPTGEDYTSIINDKQFEILQELLADAKKLGAKITEVGNRPEDASKRPHTLAPSLVTGITDEMLLATEEIFGPILPIIPYKTIDEAIAYVNARPRPLALYFFGNDTTDKRKVLNNTVSGNVTVNGTFAHIAQDDLPFGGVGESGMGQYHGKEGFLTLSHAKGIYEQGLWNGMDLLHAPFTSLTEKMINFFLR